MSGLSFPNHEVTCNQPSNVRYGWKRTDRFSAEWRKSGRLRSRPLYVRSRPKSVVRGRQPDAQKQPFVHPAHEWLQRRKADVQ